MKSTTHLLAILVAIVSVFAPALAADPADPIEHLAIVFKLHESIPEDTWLKKQMRDSDLIKTGKVLVAGIFQDG